MLPWITAGRVPCLRTRSKRNHRRKGRAITNFAAALPAPQSDLAHQTLKDPYIFDFLTIDVAARERDLELGLLNHIQKFLVELGVGFAHVGRQYRLEVSGEEFFLDLRFQLLRSLPQVADL